MRARSQAPTSPDTHPQVRDGPEELKCGIDDRIRPLVASAMACAAGRRRGTIRPCRGMRVRSPNTWSPGSALAAMVALAPFSSSSGLMAPGWAVGVFIAVWLVLFGLGCFWIRRKPLWVVLLPFIAAAFWLGGMNAGAAWLGWTP